MRAKREDAARVQDDLKNLAVIYLDKDRLEAGKLEWLSFLFGDQWRQDEAWQAELEKMGALGICWFAFFSRRWIRQVRQT